MANIQHKDIEEAQLHEVKGASTSTAGQVLVSTGAATTFGSIEDIATTGANLGDVLIADGSGGSTWGSPGGAIFGAAYFTGNSTATPIISTGVYYTLDPGTWATTVQDTLVFDTNHFTVPSDGIYELSMCVSFSGGSGGGGDAYKFAFANNGTAIANSPKLRRECSGGDVGSGSRSSYQQLSAGDEVSIQVMNEDHPESPTITDASFTMVQLKEL